MPRRRREPKLLGSWRRPEQDCLGTSAVGTEEEVMRKIETRPDRTQEANPPPHTHTHTKPSQSDFNDGCEMPVVHHTKAGTLTTTQ